MSNQIAFLKRSFYFERLENMKNTKIILNFISYLISLYHIVFSMPLPMPILELKNKAKHLNKKHLCVVHQPIM